MTSLKKLTDILGNITEPIIARLLCIIPGTGIYKVPLIIALILLQLIADVLPHFVRLFQQVENIS